MLDRLRHPQTGQTPLTDYLIGEERLERVARVAPPEGMPSLIQVRDQRFRREYPGVNEQGRALVRIVDDETDEAETFVMYFDLDREREFELRQRAKRS